LDYRKKEKIPIVHEGEIFRSHSSFQKLAARKLYNNQMDGSESVDDNQPQYPGSFRRLWLQGSRDRAKGTTRAFLGKGYPSALNNVCAVFGSSSFKDGCFMERTNDVHDRIASGLK
jgi:hypothetical protein